MKSKRIISLLLVLVMALGLITGCGGEEKKKIKVDSLPEERVTLTVGIPQSAMISDYDNNVFTSYLEEQANVDIEFVYFSSSQSEYTQQLALMCGADDELPDVIVGFNFGHYTVNEYGEEGYFIDLTGYIEEYAPNYKKMLKELDDETVKYVKEKGKNTNDGAYYGMPRVSCEAIDDIQSLIYINQNWLTKLNLPVPKTLDEFKTTLKAFKTQDPNGNGEADEIPFLGRETAISYVLNSFILYDIADFNVTDGEVWDPVKTEEFRQGIIYLNQLVNEGLYDNMNFSIASSSEYKALVSPKNGPSKVGVFVGNHETMSNRATDALSEFVALTGLEDYTGKGGYTVVKPRGISWTGFITEDCEYPAAAMKLLDVWYMDETITRQRYGEKGVDWIEEKGMSEFNTECYAKLNNMEAFFSGTSTWGSNVLGIMTHKNYLPIAQEGEGYMADASRLLGEQWNVRQNAKSPEEVAVDLVYTSEEYAIRDEKASILDTYITDEVVCFVAGEKNPNDDAKWNEFLSTMDSLGRSELMEICQNAYDRQSK